MRCSETLERNLDVSRITLFVRASTMLVLHGARSEYAVEKMMNMCMIACAGCSLHTAAAVLFLREYRYLCCCIIRSLIRPLHHPRQPTHTHYLLLSLQLL